MTTDVQWLAHLLVNAEILNPRHCKILKTRLPKDLDAREFGEILSDYDLCPDKELLQRLIDQAVERGATGQSPPQNPFAADDDSSSNREAAPIPETAPRPAPPAGREIEPNSGASIEPRATPVSSSLATERSAPTSPSPRPSPVVARRPSSCALSDETPSVPLPRERSMPSFDTGAPASAAEARGFLAQVLLACQGQGVSDLHLSAGARPFARKNRQITYLGAAPLSAPVAKLLNTALLSPAQRQQLESERDLDYALALSPEARFRVNVMEHKEGSAGTYRVVAPRIRPLAELGFESTEQIEKLLDYHNGLVLVTGPAGSGKSTTLAALVDYMNQHRSDHIICVEQPIEVVHKSARCQITQREVGRHTQSFHSALKGALRQDPDIIVIGEMRDLQTIEMAISASETGHLVIGTMHTSDAATTLNRLLDVFPAAQQQQIRAMVSESLRGILCQRLLPSLQGGVRLASELLISNVAVKNLIRESKIDSLPNVIETGARQGMVLMDKSIMRLHQAGAISGAAARANLVSEMLKAQIPA